MESAAPRPCTVTLTGNVNATFACEVAAGSVGFSIDTLSTSSQPFHVTIPCDTPTEVKVGAFTPPSCQASIDEAGGQQRSWVSSADLRVDLTSVTMPKVGVVDIAGTANGTMKGVPKGVGGVGPPDVVLRVTF